MFMFIMFVYLILMIFCSIALLKNENTAKNHGIIIDAISRYNHELIKNGKELDLSLYRYMESYDSTFYRIFDWGYENILPADKIELIRPYIKTK